MAWYVVHTQPHAESRAAAHLERQGYSVYLPKCRRWIRHARRAEAALRPLFPRYLFVSLDNPDMSWRPILSTVGVATVVRAGEGPIEVPVGIVRQLREREAEGAFDETNARRWKIGDSVRVVLGPFENMIGRLVCARDKDRVVVLFQLLGRAVEGEFMAGAVAAA